jgi:hypothetical protein
MSSSFRLSIAEMAVKLSEEKAKLLTRVGTRVKVRKYRGGEAVTHTASLPRPLAHGTWVVALIGFEGEYDCGRVTPLAPKEADRIQEERLAA